MIRAIIFDFFGVFRSDGYNRWLKHHGYTREGNYLEASERHDRGAYTDQQFFQALSDASGQPVEQVAFEMENGNELNQPLIDYLPQLRKHFKLALLSNSSSDYLRNLLKVHNLNQFFDEIVISSEVKMIKPEPEVFRHILAKLDLNPTECIFIDDNPQHVAAAKAQGIQSLVYTSVPKLQQDLSRTIGNAQQL